MRAAYNYQPVNSIGCLPMNSDEREPLLTVDEAAEALHVSASTIRRRLRDGDLSAVQFGPGRAIRIDRRALTQRRYGRDEGPM